MEKEVQIVSLDRDTVLMALPVIREAAPEMTVERLRAYVENLTRNGDDSESPSGILAARSPNGYIRALATYRTTLELRWGRTLVVDNFLVPGPLYNRMCASALLDALDALAAKHHCVAIEAQLPPDDEWAGVMAKSRGYDFEGSKVCKSTVLGRSSANIVPIVRGASVQ